tara:strand:- start:2833 stop:3351 length:519 start_codon:yes stop_codon:yes gene_type:complete
MIQEIETGIPSDTNKRIIEVLFKLAAWQNAIEYKGPSLNRPDAGFILSTFNTAPNSSYCPNDVLNTYAYTVFDMVNKNTFTKFKQVNRIYWNWYHPGSEMKFHRDADGDNEYSILYNIHDNDGGTEIKINNEVKFYKSIESKALVYPSIIYHRGVAPKKDFNRFSLNILGAI